MQIALDNINTDIFSLFDEQFSVSDFKESIIKSEIQSDRILSTTKESVQKALNSAENLDETAKYVVDMDDDILESLEKGDLKFVTGEDGAIYAQLRNSNGRFGSKLPIKRELEETGISIEALQMAIQVKAIEEIANYDDKVNILEDLDVKASDILQVNGIIWVEGPSDRVYIKRWLDIFCNCEYQFLYYGGRLLSHYTASDVELNNLISILITNRNSAIVIDSDKKVYVHELMIRRKELKKNFQIENYIAG